MLQTRLVTLLRDERRAILARDWARVSEFAQAKSEAMEALTTTDVPHHDLRAVHRESQENERLLGIAKDAARSVTTRLAAYAESGGPVAYEEDGRPVMLTDVNQPTRV